MATPWSPLSLFITVRGVMMMMWAHWVSLDWVGAAWHWPRNDKGLTSSERGLGPHTALCTVCVWVMAIVIYQAIVQMFRVTCIVSLNPQYLFSLYISFISFYPCPLCVVSLYLLTVTVNHNKTQSRGWVGASSSQHQRSDDSGTYKSEMMHCLLYLYIMWDTM